MLLNSQYKKQIFISKVNIKVKFIDNSRHTFFYSIPFTYSIEFKLCLSLKCFTYQNQLTAAYTDEQVKKLLTCQRISTEHFKIIKHWISSTWSKVDIFQAHFFFQENNYIHLNLAELCFWMDFDGRHSNEAQLKKNHSKNIKLKTCS